MEDTELARQLLEVIPSAIRHIRCELRRLAKPELTVPQFRILAHLARGSATNGQLAEWLGVSPPAATQMIDGLEHQGLIERTRAEEDRRQVHVRLTAKGQALFENVLRAAQATFAEYVARLRPEQKAELMTGLAVLREMFP
jgi:DNA-binding MarR family transcriptional regulator